MTTRFLAIAVLACAAPALAGPDLRQARRAGPLVVYPDDARRNLFYFPPGDLVIATGEAARPTSISCTRGIPDPRRQATAARLSSAASSPCVSS